MKTRTFLLLAITLIVVGLLGFTMQVLGQTNAPPAATGIDIPGLNVLPAPLQKWVLIFVVLSPFIGRAWYSLRSGGGIRGIINAIWFGTNSPTDKTDSKGDSGSGLWMIIGLLAFGLVAPVTTGCTIFGKTPRTAEAQKFDTFKSVYAGAREAYKTFKRECFAGKVTAKNEATGDKAWYEFRIAYGSAVKIAMSEDATATDSIIALKTQFVRLLLTL